MVKQELLDIARDTLRRKHLRALHPQTPMAIRARCFGLGILALPRKGGKVDRVHP